MKPISKLAILLVLAFPLNALACFPAKITLQQRAQNADAIFVGTVTRIDQLKKDSQTGISTGMSPSSSSSKDSRLSLIVSLSETIKGETLRTTINPKILNCGSGNASLNDKVIVFLSGEYWFTQVYKQQDYENLLSLDKP